MKVFSNLAISLDGKIADPAVPHKMLGSPEDRRRMDVIRKKADVVIFGATTLRAMKKCVKVKKSKVPLANAVVTASGKLDPDLSFWNDKDVIRFVFTTAKGEAEALLNSQDRAFVVVVGEKEINPEIVLRRLKESGFENILIEGGGETMALFLAKKLIQELFVTLTPWILGGRSSPTLVGGDGCLAPWLRLKKLRADWKQEDLFLHYQVKGARRV